MHVTVHFKDNYSAFNSPALFAFCMTSNLVAVSLGAVFITTAYYLKQTVVTDKFWFWLAGRNYAEKELEQDVLLESK